MQSPEVSIVVPVRRAETTIRPTLEALFEQCRGRPAEIVAVVSTEDPAREVLRELSGCPVLRVVEIAGRRSVPQLRAEGVRAARGSLVVFTEDHCLFSPDWLAAMIEIHGQREAAAVGGPVENGRTSGLLDWAIYFSRYLGSMPPVSPAAVPALPGNNACYRREALERFRRRYEHGFWEHEINRELAASGYVLWQDPRPVVTHNKPYRFAPYLALRYRHARCFGAREGGGIGRALASPLAPALLAWRAVRTVRRKRRRQRQFWLAFPALLLCYLVWSWGELIGRLFGAGDTCSETD